MNRGRQKNVATQTSHSENVSDVVHHNVHAGKLRPDLSKDTDVCSVNHIGLEQLHIGNVGVGSLELNDFSNFSQFLSNEWGVGVTAAMDKRQDLMSFLPSVFSSEPSWRFWQEEKSKEKKDSWNHLKTPWDTESSVSFEEGATIANVEHDENTPGDSPLLATDESSTLRWWCNLGNIDGNLSGADSNRETVDDTSDDKHGNVLGSANDD